MKVLLFWEREGPFIGPFPEGMAEPFETGKRWDLRLRGTQNSPLRSSSRSP